MTQPTKISFAHRRIAQVDDITDLVAILFPNNRNQQHAAARVMLTLKCATELTASLNHLEHQHGISRRTLERVRAKLTNLGLIERVSWMNRRYAGREGWKLSSRMSGALRQWADKLDEWRSDGRPERQYKDVQLVGLLQ